MKNIQKLFIALALLIGIQVSTFAQEGFIGEIRMFGGNFAPRGWAFCDGQIMQISQHTALFSIIGTTYGGDGRVTFGLPDLRGRVAIAPGTGSGLSTYRLGQKTGTEQRTISVNELPSHTHTATGTVELSIPVNTDPGTVASPENNYLAKSSDRGNIFSSTETTGKTLAPVSATTTVTVAPAGGSQPIDIRQPSLAVNYIICLTGIYPSRN